MNLLVLILYQIFIEIAFEGVSALQKRMERVVSAPNRQGLVVLDSEVCRSRG
jgi:hypothetical protein